MDSNSEVAFDASPRFLIYKNGCIQRLSTETFVPPSQDAQNDDVVSKDILYSTEKNLSLRIYLAHKAAIKTSNQEKKKLPLLVYFHGGGFIMERAFTQTYHTFVTSAVSASECMAVSVDYRRAPENPIPAAYEDSWDAIKWVFTHINGSGQEDWLNGYADFSKVFISGDSAGANISHHMVMRAGKEKLKISGMIMFHPYFWSKTPIDEYETKDVKIRKYMEEMWKIASPNSVKGLDDPWFNVVESDSSDISELGCERVLVMVAEKDALVRQGLGYAAKLEKSGWGGKVEVFESENEDHVFFLTNPNSDNARRVVERFAKFVKE